MNTTPATTTAPETQASVLGEWLTARGWTPVPDEDSHDDVEVTCWAWDRATHPYQGSMLPTQIMTLGRGDVEVIAAHPYTGDPAVTGVATRRMSGQVCRQIVEELETQVLDDVEACRLEALAAEVMETDVVKTAIRKAAAQISGGDQVASIIISRAGDEMRWVIDDVHVIGAADDMSCLTRGLTRLVAGEVPSVLWADLADSVQIERATVADPSDVYVKIYSSRYGDAQRRITMGQAAELARIVARHTAG